MMKCSSCKTDIGFGKSVKLILDSTSKNRLTCAHCSTVLHPYPNQTGGYFKFIIFILLWIGLVLFTFGMLFGRVLGYRFVLGTVFWLWILVLFVFGALILSNLAFLFFNKIYIRAKASIEKGGDILDKRVLIFYSLFTLFMIGGSFVLSLWVFPYILPEGRYNIMFSHDGLARAESIQSDPDVYMGPGHEKGVRTGPGFARLVIAVGSAGLLCVAMFLFLRVRKGKVREGSSKMQGALYEICRSTGNSEYDLFYRAAVEWGVPDKQVERDFNMYISTEIIPYYVNDFVRKNIPNRF